MATKREKKTPKPLQEGHALLGWVIPHLDESLRHRCFTVGERIESTLMRCGVPAYPAGSGACIG